MSEHEGEVPVSKSAPDTASGGPAEGPDESATTDDDGTPVENPSG
jgi:hypothetical protein